MIWYAVKLLVSAGVIVLISELSKKASSACQFNRLSSIGIGFGDDLDVWRKSRS